MAALSFSERMAEGKAVAMSDRNKGKHTGRCAAGWNRKRPALTGLDRLEWQFETWVKEWEYGALAAVETALFAHEWEGL